MSRTAVLERARTIVEGRTPAPAPAEYLGPAEVTGAFGGEVAVELPDGTRGTARLALAFPYQPAVGDTLLVIARGEARYVIGVLQGSGASTLAFPGSVHLRAEGELHLEGGAGVRVSGPEVSIDAGKLHVMAEAAVEKLGSLYQKVRALWSVRAGESEILVDETALTRARSASILTEETMTINGQQIHLG